MRPAALSAANGLRPAQNNYMLDGIDNNSDTVDFLNGTNYVVLPPVDAIQEFKVQTRISAPSSAAPAPPFSTPPSNPAPTSSTAPAWEFFRNDKLDAADYFENCRRTSTKGRTSPEPIRGFRSAGR